MTLSPSSPLSLSEPEKGLQGDYTHNQIFPDTELQALLDQLWVCGSVCVYVRLCLFRLCVCVGGGVSVCVCVCVERDASKLVNHFSQITFCVHVHAGRC